MLYTGLIFVVIVISMTIHEAMHAFVSYGLGDDTAQKEGRITLNPLKHIDPFLTIILPLVLAVVGAPIFGGAKPVPFNPDRVRGGEWGSALVALAGPFTNLLIAFVAFGVGVLTGGITASGFSPTVGGVIVLVTIQVNLGFFVFNMLPIPPLDGSRVLYALAPEFVRRGMEMIERYGLVVIFVLVLLASPIIAPIMQAAIQGILTFFQAVFRV
jgi:Zn-dependent protease